MSTYEIHPLANIAPMTNQSELESLKNDIAMNGQREPVLLYKDKIIDGRNRQLVCEKLDIDLKVKILDPNLTKEELYSLVKSYNTRRNLTDSQKVAKAVLEQVNYGGKNKDIAKANGISERTFENGKYIYKQKPEFIDDLFNGKTVVIHDPNRKRDITTNKITTIARLLKLEKEMGNIVVDKSEEVKLEWSSDALIKTEAGKEWFNSKKHLYNITDRGLIFDLIELANYKYKYKEPSLDNVEEHY